ncbi:hypothetical protein B0H10DRAFT_1953401 [Mycena sp. CBHHK59/15]|nr:hypothetical protein B0H10DRAFT_1953401 [Mycena sp. CBHHK59/15]
MSSPCPPESFPMLIPEAVTSNSQTNPGGLFYTFAELEPSTEVINITHLEFGRATHRAAQILRPNREGSDGQVVAFIALSDTVLYHAILVGLITANLIPFPISPRNSAAAVVKLLRKTACHRLIATCVTLEPLISGIKEKINQLDPEFCLDIEEVPSLARVYPNLGFETPEWDFQPYAAYIRPSLDDICIYLHSSGSTGLPKAIGQTHRALMQWSSFAAVTEMRDYVPQPIGSMALPSFHVLGMYGQLLRPLYGGICAAVYPPVARSPNALPVFPSPDNILDHAQKTKCNGITVIPALLATWSNSPDAVAYLKNLHLVAWSGSSLPQRLGKFLFDAGIKLRVMYGATEFGAISTIVPLKGDEHEWEWLRFPESQVKLRWIPQGDGIFECQVLTWENHNVMVENLQDVKGYATSDLFINHPKKKHLWKIVGRIDDVIVHTSGEKTVPTPMEDIVMSSPFVTGAVMFGREREQTGILIETIPSLQIDVRDATQLTELRNKLWPMIEEANKIAPAFSRIFKEMIIATSVDKPFPRAGKGTVMRKAAISLHALEIEALYDTIETQMNITDTLKSPPTWETTAIQGWLLEIAADLSNGTKILAEFECHFLTTADPGCYAVFQRITVQRAADGVAQNLIYSYPTISQLSVFLNGLVVGKPNETGDPKLLIEKMVSTYISGLAPAVVSRRKANDPVVVVLTSSTGNLGSHVLVSLLNDDKVTKVYAFNRPSSPVGPTLAERHRIIFDDRGLDTALLASPKLTLVEGQIDWKNLGVKPDLYNEILHNTGLNVSCVRIGQVCGALPKGAWATSDWVPILVKTSIALGRLPLANGLVSWIDFETVAQALMDVAFSALKNSEHELYPALNLVHPRPVAWNFVMTTLRDTMKQTNGSTELQLVGFSDWCTELETSAASGQYPKDSERLPGLKLLGFFRHLVKVSVGHVDSEIEGRNFCMDKMQALSSALKEADSIRTENVEAWVRYWSLSGFISL